MRLLAALLLVLLPTVSPASITFERRWHWFQQAAGRSVELSGDGGYVVGAGTWISGSNYGATLAWVDSLGDTTTVRHIAGLDYGAGCMSRVADSGYVVAGTRDTHRVFAQKFDANGDSVWTYVSAHHGLVTTVFGTADGGCLVAGRIPDTLFDFGLVKLNAEGSEAWMRTYQENRLYSTIARAVAATHDGGYIICGHGYDYGGSYPRLVRVDSSGETLWTRIYSGPVGASLQDVRENPDGGIMAVGSELDSTTGHTALYVMLTDSAGNVVRTVSLPVSGAGTLATTVAATHNGGYIVAGQLDRSTSARVWLVRIDFAGDTAWSREVEGPGREGAADIMETEDGGFVIAGTSDSAGGSVLLIKTDSLGRLGIAERSQPLSERVAFSVAPNPTNGVVKVEWSLPTSSTAGLSLYDALGRQVFSSSGLRTSPFEIRTSSLPQGVYLLRLESDCGSATRKLVIK